MPRKRFTNEQIAFAPRRGFEAGRALRAVLREIGAAPWLVLWQLGRLQREAERRIGDRFARIAEGLRKAESRRIRDRARTPSPLGLDISR